MKKIFLTILFLLCFVPSVFAIDGYPVVEGVDYDSIQGTTTYIGGTSGVSLTGSNGSITLLGKGDGFDEALTADFNTTSNTIGITSPTGVTLIDFGTIDISTDTLTLTGTGTLNGLDVLDATSIATIQGISVGGDATGTIGSIAVTDDSHNHVYSNIDAMTSANLDSIVTDNTGSGALVFANTPTLVTPNIGVATGTSLQLTGDVTGPVGSIYKSASGGLTLRGFTGSILDFYVLTGTGSALMGNPTGTSNIWFAGNVGFGLTTTPLAKLQLGSNTGGSSTYTGDILIDHTGITGSEYIGGIEFKTDNSANGYGWKITPKDPDNGGEFIFSSRSNSATWTDRFIFTGNNFGIGLTTFGTAADKNLGFASGTAPTTSPADAAQIWVADMNSAPGYARIFERTESGVGSPIVLMQEVDSSINSRIPSQGVYMTAATSGSNGIQSADNNNFDMGINNFTLIWKGQVPLRTPAANVILMQKNDATNGYTLTLLTSGKFEVTINTTNYDSTVANTFIDGTVHKIFAVITRETVSVAGSVVFYVDGYPLGESVPITAGVPTTVNNAVPLYVMGTSATRSAGTTYFSTVLNYALSTVQVLDIYRNGLNFYDKWGSQTAKNVSTCINGTSLPYNTFNGASATGFHVISTGGAGNYIASTADELAVVIGYKYRVSFTSASQSGQSVTVSFLASQGGAALINGNVGTFSADGSYSFEVTATTTNTGLMQFYNSNNAEYTISNLSVTPLGATFAIEPEGILTDKWYDSSSNNLDFSYPAAGSSLTRKSRDVIDGNLVVDGTTSNRGLTVLYNNIATEGYGVPAIVDHVALTGQSASIGTTAFTNANVAGTYRVNYYLEATTLNVGATSIMLTVSFTDAAGATTVTSIALPLTALGRTSGVFYVQLASGSISYATTYIDVTTLSRYALYCDVERLS